MSALVYLIGEPGSGKSTLMAELTARCSRLERRTPFAHTLLVRSREIAAVELGRRRAAFSGTDALALSVEPVARSWIATQTFPLVLGEGDRLATLGFLDAAHRAGLAVTLVWCRPPDQVCTARRSARGTAQSPTWVRGRATKVARVADQSRDRGWPVICEPCIDPPDVVAARLSTRVPALEVLA